MDLKKDILNDYRIKELLFDVELRKVFVEHKKEKKEEEHFVAICNVKSNKVFKIATSSYKLISNKKALTFALDVAKILFPEQINNFKILNVTKAKSLGQCTISMLDKDNVLFSIDKTKWIPFIYLTNSYNGVYAFDVMIGFSDGKSSIFTKQRATKYKNSHSTVLIASNVISSEKFKQIVNIFEANLNNIQRYYVNKDYFLPLLLKIHNISLEKYEKYEKKGEMKNIVEEKTENIEQNAYYALMLAIEIADEFPDFFNTKSKHTLKPSYWIDSFCGKIENKNFKFEDYLKDYKTIF